MAGAKKPEQIKIVGGDGNIYVVDTWNRGTIADGVAMTEYTIRPICSAIQVGTSGLAAEIERAMAAERAISGIVDSHYEEYNTFVSSVNTSAEALSAELAKEISAREHGDDDLQDQIDTLKAATDVIAVFGTYPEFTAASAGPWQEQVTDNDFIKVLRDNAYNPTGDEDANTNDEDYYQVYYQWHSSAHDGWDGWSAIGNLDPYYSVSEIDKALDKINNEFDSLSSTVADNYLSANGNAVSAGKNIKIDYEQNKPKITINTKEDVEFNNVSSKNVSSTNVTALTAQGNSAKFTNLSATNLNNEAISNLFNSALSGVAASAYITKNSADFLNSAHSAYNKLTFKYGTSTQEYPATNSSYNFIFSAGQGVSFITGDNQVTITAEGRAYTGENYIKVDNTTKKISVTGNLITSAKAGSAASAWINNTLFDYSYTKIDTATASGSIDKIKIFYKNDADDHDVMLNQEMVFERDGYSVSGLLIPAANRNTDNGKVLTYNSAVNNYAWKAIPDSTYTNEDDYISVDNEHRKINLSTTGIKTSAYYAEFIDGSNHYNSDLNGERLVFNQGFGGLYISLSGVTRRGSSSSISASWDNLFKNYAEVNRTQLNTTSNLTADKVNFIVATGSSGTQPYKAVNFVVTSTLPSRLEDNTYYIV